MAITKPKWCPPGTLMTRRGWVHPKTGEILACKKFTEEDIIEWKKATGLQRKSPVKKPDKVKKEKIKEPEDTIDLVETPAPDDLVITDPVEEPVIDEEETTIDPVKLQTESDERVVLESTTITE